MATETRALHFNLNFINSGTHSSAWRWPGNDPRAFIDPDFYVAVAKTAERGFFDAIFFPDNPALTQEPRFRPFNALEPTLLLATIAARTGHIGLIATMSSTLNEPYNVARRFASLDILSNGRAGWNVVTTADRGASANFGLQDTLAHARRYARAAEFTHVVKSLWDSWEDDALVADPDSGAFIDTRKIYPLNHHGEFFDVAGALNLPRPPQGRPIVVQAGGSNDGRDLAAAHADAVFTLAYTLEEAVAYTQDIDARARRFGRTRDDIRIFPGLVTVIGGTEAEVRQRLEVHKELSSFEYGLARLAGSLRIDPKSLALDEPLPKDLALHPDHNHTFFKGIVELAAAKGGLTVRELVYHQLGGTSHRIIAGTPEQVADDIETWLRSGAIDGFNVMPDVLPSGLDAFVNHVIPELRRRGLYRDGYPSHTLRGNLGLDRPANPRAGQPSLAEQEHVAGQFF
ncbi:MAG TPA: NtaA/DmoA family FMN-dependent monooxygenase [Bordetella sp.]